MRFVILDEQPEPYEKKRDFCRLDAAGVSLLSFSKEICLEGELYENRCAVDFHCGVCAAASAAQLSGNFGAGCCCRLYPAGDRGAGRDRGSRGLERAADAGRHHGNCGSLYPLQYAQPPVRPSGCPAAQRQVAHYCAGVVCGPCVRLCGQCGHCADAGPGGNGHCQKAEDFPSGADSDHCRQLQFAGSRHAGGRYHVHPAGRAYGTGFYGLLRL